MAKGWLLEVHTESNLGLSKEERLMALIRLEMMTNLRVQCM